MKKYLLSLLFLFPGIASSQRVTANLSCVNILDHGVAVIVGAGGTMLRSTDSGMTWALIGMPTHDWLNEVAFRNPAEAILITSHGNVLVSWDSGFHWTDRNVGAGNAGICFADSNFILSLGTDGTIFKSTDFGVSFNVALTQTVIDDAYDGKSSYNFGNIKINARGEGEAFGYGIIRVGDRGSVPGSTVPIFSIPSSTDFGRSWNDWWAERETEPTAWFVGDVAPSGRVFGFGYTGGGYPNLFSSSLGSAFKDSLSYPVGLGTLSTGSIRSVKAVSDSFVVAVGEKARFCSTHNGGREWKSSQLLDSGVFTSVAMNDAGYGLIVGNNGVILRTLDSGLTWSSTDTITKFLGIRATAEESQHIMYDPYSHTFSSTSDLATVAVFNTIGQRISILSFRVGEPVRADIIGCDGLVFLIYNQGGRSYCQKIIL